MRGVPIGRFDIRRIVRSTVWGFAVGAAVFCVGMENQRALVLGGSKPPCDAAVGTGSCVSEDPNGFCIDMYQFCDFSVGPYGDVTDCDDANFDCTPLGTDCEIQWDTYFNSSNKCTSQGS